MINRELLPGPINIRRVRVAALIWSILLFGTLSVTTLRLTPDSRSAELVRTDNTDPTRVFTTAQIAHSRLLLVDSKFDGTLAAPPYEVVALKLLH